jgi:hypothetical protein
MHKRNIIYISVVLTALGLYSCVDKITNPPNENKPPTTKIFMATYSPDSLVSKQQSRIKIYWSGDDPDGFVAGFYFSWDNIHWTFTPKNDSLFALQIGAVDSVFVFRVSAVDNSGNGTYDNAVLRNNINYGAEPFTDLNSNGTWDAGEPFTDIGAIDPNPASLRLPIQNTAPDIAWNVISTLPDSSFPVMSFKWNATDLDGDATISAIRIALNDTNNFVSINGGIRTITIRINDLNAAVPKMDILVDGNPNNLVPVKLPGLLYNAKNVFYAKAVDISGATSSWIASTAKNNKWFVKKPKGKLLIIDDYTLVDQAAAFYRAIMDSLGLTNKFDVFDVKNQPLPLANVTFFETMKLFGYSIWYSDYNNPSLDLANATAPKYLDFGGKILFSMQFPTLVDLNQIQGFLPINADSSQFTAFLFPSTEISADSTDPAFPKLTTSSSIARARTFYLPPIGVKPVYYFPNGELKGSAGFENSTKNLFFIGFPLHLLNGTPDSIRKLLHKVLFIDFNLTNP